MSNKPPLLLASPSVDDRTRASLAAEYEVRELRTGTDSSAMIASLSASLRALVTDGHVGADAALMDALPKLGLIACYGVGYDGIDVGAAQARGIQVTHTPDVLTEEVADFALALLLCSARRVSTAHRFVQDGRWGHTPFPLTRSIAGRTVGILGLGRIGKAIARRLEAFRMRVLYTGRQAQADATYPFVPDLVELARQADMLVVACPGGPATHHLVTREVLRALGPDGTLINIGRGTTVDEWALVEALERNEVGAAALDVLEHEPEVPDVLLRSERVLITPHIASGTVETRAAIGDLVRQNLAAFFAGQPLVTPVTTP